MGSTFIFGHRNPDTDAICSTIAYTEYKRKKGYEVAGVRLGDLNNETKFVLKYFQADEPEMLKTIKTQVSDLAIDKPISIKPDISIKKAWMLMKENNSKELTIIDEGNKLIGIVTLSDITKSYMEVQDEKVLFKKNTPLGNILDTLNASIICGNMEDFEPSGRVLVAALERERLNEYIKAGDIVIMGNKEECIIEVIKSGANLIISTCNVRPGQKAIAAAKKRRCLIISTPNDTFTTARLIHQSVPVRYVMTTDNIIEFKIDDLVDDVRDKMLKTRYRSYPVVNEEQKVLGMVSRYHLIAKNRKKAVLLDHNERSQTAAGIEDAEIIEIIDHHRLGDIQTNSPILMHNEPVGSTATIIAKMYLNEKELLTTKIAGLLLAAIISDTLKFRSPTTTQEDINVVSSLASIAEIDVEEFALKLFNAGSNLEGKSVDEIINGDLKEYQLGKYKMGMSQVYSINSENLSDFNETLDERMGYYCGRNGFAVLILLITDLDKNGSEVIFTGERKDIVTKAFSLNTEVSRAFLPGVLSRKKQIVPKIMSIVYD